MADFLDFLNTSSGGNSEIDRLSIPILVGLYVISMVAFVLTMRTALWLLSFCVSKRMTGYIAKKHYAFRIRLEAFLFQRAFLKGVPVIILYEIFIGIVSSISCAIFIYISIEVAQNNLEIMFEPRIYVAEFCLSLVFLFDYILYFLVEDKKLWYFLNLNAIVDLISVIPGILGIFGRYFYTFQFLRIFRIYRALDIFRKSEVSTRLRIGRFQFTQHFLDLVQVAFGFVCLLFMCAGFIFVSENSVQNEGGKVSNFLDAFYFSLVTMTTVGYGDISPVSRVGKAVFCIFFIIFLLSLPYHLSRLSHVAKEFVANKAYTYSDSSIMSFLNISIGDNDGFGHVVLFAKPSTYLLDFLKEFYHTDRNRYNTVKVCVMTPPATETEAASGTYQTYESDLERMLAIPFYRKRIKRLIGDPTAEGNLRRCKMDTCVACFVFSTLSFYFGDNSNVSENELDQTIYNEDAKAVLITLAVKGHRPDIPCFVKLTRGGILERDNSPRGYGFNFVNILRKSGVEVVISTEEFAYKLLAQSCICYGVSTLLLNLIRTASTQRSDSTRYTWEKEYLRGTGFEIYTHTVKSFIQDSHSPFLSQAFNEMQLITYAASKGRVMLFAIDKAAAAVFTKREAKARKKKPDQAHVGLRLNPSVAALYITQGDVLYFFAQDATDLRHLEKKLSTTANYKKYSAKVQETTAGYRAKNSGFAKYMTKRKKELKREQMQKKALRKCRARNNRRKGHHSDTDGADDMKNHVSFELDDLSGRKLKADIANYRADSVPRKSVIDLLNSSVTAEDTIENALETRGNLGVVFCSQLVDRTKAAAASSSQKISFAPDALVSVSLPQTVKSRSEQKMPKFHVLDESKYYRNTGVNGRKLPIINDVRDAGLKNHILVVRADFSLVFFMDILRNRKILRKGLQQPIVCLIDSESVVFHSAKLLDLLVNEVLPATPRKYTPKTTLGKLPSSIRKAQKKRDEKQTQKQLRKALIYFVVFEKDGLMEKDLFRAGIHSSDLVLISPVHFTQRHQSIAEVNHIAFDDATEIYTFRLAARALAKVSLRNQERQAAKKNKKKKKKKGKKNGKEKEDLDLTVSAKLLAMISFAQNIKYLGAIGDYANDLEKGTDWMKHPMYASGNVMPLSLWDTLLCHCFFVPKLDRMLDLFLSRACILLVPSGPFGDDRATFQEVFYSLHTKKGLLLVGIYRSNTESVVQTSTKATDILRQSIFEYPLKMMRNFGPQEAEERTSIFNSVVVFPAPTFELQPGDILYVMVPNVTESIAANTREPDHLDREHESTFSTEFTEGSTGGDSTSRDSSEKTANKEKAKRANVEMENFDDIIDSDITLSSD